MVSDTRTATTTSTPRSLSVAVPLVERPATTTPVTMFRAGTAVSSLSRSGTAGRPIAKSSGRSCEIRSITGRIDSSMRK